MSQDHFIGKNISLKDALSAKNRQLKIKGGSESVAATTYHHEEAMDQMWKAIEMTNMERRTKAVMKLRLLGYSFEWMQNYLINNKYIIGCTIESLKLEEAQGKALVLETLQKFTMSEIVGSINAKPKVILGLQNELTNPGFGLS